MDKYKELSEVGLLNGDVAHINDYVYDPKNRKQVENPEKIIFIFDFYNAKFVMLTNVNGNGKPLLYEAFQIEKYNVDNKINNKIDIKEYINEKYPLKGNPSNNIVYDIREVMATIKGYKKGDA